MNYLAHSYLTFNDGQIVGQFLEDYIKNKDRFSVPKEIQNGIILHRRIDTYTDAHPAISEAKKVFQPLVRLYSGAFVDVAMDYFLAHDENIYTAADWKKHSLHVYRILNDNLSYFPENFILMLAKMEEDDWLFNYRKDWGIKFSMQNVLNKAKYLDKKLPVFEVFLQNRKILQECYHEFFPQLLLHVQEENAVLQKK